MIDDIRVPKNIFQKALSAISALVSGETVGEMQMRKRVEVCAQCEYVREANGEMRCGICGCKISGDRGILNLAKFVETDSYGCKHPNGSQWKANGC